MPVNVVGTVSQVATLEPGLVQAASTPLYVDVQGFSWEMDGSKGTYVGAVAQAVVDEDTNYVYLDSSGVLQINVTGFPGVSVTHIRLARVVTTGGEIVNIVDERSFFNSGTGGGGGSDELVKVSADDTTAGYLEAKVTAVSPITLTTLNPAGDEDLQISLGTVDHGDLGGVTSDQHHARQHALGAAADHTSATLAQVNALVSDATLDDSSGTRDPNAHGLAAHTGTIGAHSQLSGVGADDHHAHANKAQLDLVTDGDHDLRTDNPHSVTAAQAGAAASPHAIDGADHTGTLDHGGLGGLTDVADHPGYLDLAGTRSMTGNLLMNAQNVRGVKAADFGAGVSLGSLGATPTINWQSGNKQKGTLSANATVTFTAPHGWGNLMLELVQDATGGRSVTWPAAVLWGGGVAPDFSSMGASEVALVALFYDGTNYLAEARLGYS